MSTSATFTSSSFFVEAAKQVSGTAVRVTFTAPCNITGVTGGSSLNPANYTLAGPGLNSVVLVTRVAEDPHSVDLTAAAPFVAGDWTVNALNVLALSGVGLSAPKFATFKATTYTAPAPLSGGAENDDIQHLLRKFLSPALLGPGWDALISAIATGDQYNHDTAISAFDQLFLSTATGNYLNRKAADVGLVQPSRVGIGTEIFRKLAIKTTATKLTSEVILECLEAYYGSVATRANMTTVSAQPFALGSGDSIVVQIDEGTPLTVVFSDKDFALPGQASALEVAAVMTRFVRNSGLTAFATPVTDSTSGLIRVRLFSGALGMRGSIRVLGGSAQRALFFPQYLDTYAS